MCDFPKFENMASSTTLPDTPLPSLTGFVGGTCYTLSGSTKKYEDDLFSYTAFTNIALTKQIAPDNSYMVYSYLCPTTYLCTDEVTSYTLKTFYGKLTLEGGSIQTKTIYFRKMTINPGDSDTSRYVLSITAKAYRAIVNEGLPSEYKVDGIVFNTALMKGSKSISGYKFLEGIELRFTCRATYDTFDSITVLPFTSFTINEGYDTNLVDSEYLLYTENIRPVRLGNNVRYLQFSSTEMTWTSATTALTTVKLKLLDGTSIVSDVKFT